MPLPGPPANQTVRLTADLGRSGPVNRPPRQCLCAASRVSMTAWWMRARDSPLLSGILSTWRSSSPLTTRCTLTRGTPGSASRSAHPVTAAPRSARRSMRTTSWPPPRRSASTGPPAASTGRSTWAPIPTRCPAGVGQRPGGTGREQRPRAGRRARGVRTDTGGVPRDPGPQRVKDRTSRRRDRGHALTQPAVGRRLQVQPDHAAWPAPISPGRSRTGRTNCWPTD